MISIDNSFADQCPIITLGDQNFMPQLALGTWRLKPEDTEEIVYNAIVKLGYRHIDCAAFYLNEKEVGKAIKSAMNDANISREELFIVSKLWNTHHKSEHVREALDKTLDDLQLSYLDLYLIHWPVSFEYGGPNYEDFVPTNKDGFPKLACVSLQETWRAMESLCRQGLIRALGTSSFNVSILLELLSFAEISPVVNQLECHPFLLRNQLADFMKRFHIAKVSFSPLGSGFVGPLHHAAVDEIAKKYKKSPAQILLKWNLQKGNSVIVKSDHLERLAENTNIFDFAISPDDIGRLDSLDCQKMFCDPFELFKIPLFAL